MKTHSRYQVARKVLIFWCLFIGIGAVAGSIGMLISIHGGNLGMKDMLPYFQVLPFADRLFQNFLFPGIALLCVNGIPNLAAAVLLFLKKKPGVVFGTIFGVTLMGWICIQFVIFPHGIHQKGRLCRCSQRNGCAALHHCGEGDERYFTPREGNRYQQNQIKVTL